ncbi:sialidase family protein [Neobacillus niacini]|uniref:sialidase family protein n=1 Tax=Neobacillus niacini TaxID=86668 RepID=UPI002041AF6B|nr:sialidase family protein [Neobacillus niacini]MCM3693783.1 exo-alpha-sialidase [Neobacillus niacini]
MVSFLITIFVFGQDKYVSAMSSANTPDPILHVENQRIKDGYFTNLNNQVDQLKGMDEGTIIVRFQYTGSSIMSLFSLSNNQVSAGHFHLYITPSAIGSENRFEKPGETKTNVHVNAQVKLKENQVHTLAMVVDKEEGYKYFLDGELIKADTQTPRKFLSNIYAPNSSQLGRTERSSGNQYPFNGNIDFVKVFNEPLSNEVLTTITGETKAKSLENPLPDTVTKPLSIFYPGFMDSNNYRIPALLYTEKGTLIAGIDRRVVHGGDSPNNIDAVIRRSFDQGQTWEEDGIVINDYPDQASNIDLTLLQDKSNERIFTLVDGFPHGAGLMGGFGTNAYKGTGFKTVDGKVYMYLKDENNKEYTIRENGIVYDESGTRTEYSVDEDRNLYLKGEKIDNYFSQTSPLKPFKTSYLELYYSDDEGKTWTGPIDLNDEVKEEWMIFLGTGPGNGIQLTEGPYEGRLVFPVYFLNEYNKQASAIIYSDDHGKTWHRGESPNEGRVVGEEIINERYFTNSAHEITESQVVEMPDGQLKLFMRNYSGYAQIATSFDGGETWESDVVTEKALTAPYSQMSAIRYEGQVDGKEAVIFSSASDRVSRVNGTVKVGLIEEDGTYENGRTKYSFNWKYSQLVKEGQYGYSSLTNLSNGDIGLFYEGTANTAMDYIKFNMDFLKSEWQRYKPAPKPVITSFNSLSKNPIPYRPGDKIQIEVVFDDFVMLIGNKRINGLIGGKEIQLDLVKNTDNFRFIFEGVIPNIKPRAYTAEFKLDNNLSIYNVYGELFEATDEAAEYTEKMIIRAE